MVQAVTYQSDKQSVYFQGKLIVLENLTPVLSPEEKKKRKGFLKTLVLLRAAR